MKILNVVGARPNFIKIAPLLEEQKKYPRHITSILVHTGQHYSPNLSRVIFNDLMIPTPDIHLGVGAGTHAVQTAKIMMRFEKVLIDEKPDLVIVVGDVNSTLACSLAASKVGVKIAHVESGLRSNNQMMPEEINRILTDRLSTFLFTPDIYANQNLLKEGIVKEKIYLVGNIMIDSLKKLKTKAGEKMAKKALNRKEYVLLTLHRQENVDKKANLKKLLVILSKIHIPVIFPMHPRTRLSLKKFGLDHTLSRMSHVKILRPLGYIDFLNLEMRAKIVLTDSGGIQEETTFLGIPCLTLRNETERPITVKIGTNKVVGLNIHKVLGAIEDILKGESKKRAIPPYWDGKTSQRIIAIILRHAI